MAGKSQLKFTTGQQVAMGITVAVVVVSAIHWWSSAAAEGCAVDGRIEVLVRGANREPHAYAFECTEGRTLSYWLDGQFVKVEVPGGCTAFVNGRRIAAAATSDSEEEGDAPVPGPTRTTVFAAGTVMSLSCRGCD